MSLESHVVELQKKHANIAKMIEEEQRSPAADPLQITALKRQKLLLKEEIARAS